MLTDNQVSLLRKKEILLYGANGYTGQLIARFATDYALKPILAGRRNEALKTLAEKLNLNYKVFELTDKSARLTALEDVAVVIHAAGPFDVTAIHMVKACLETGTHYIDLNGDKDVFEMLLAYDSEAKEKAIMLLPGAGFDVVPTDCIAMYLKNKLPDATHLEIAFATPGGSISHGTAVTTVSKLGEPGAVRKDGKLIPVPIGHKSMWINFFRGKGKADLKIFTMTIPWGDVFTAYISTGIPNIEAYTAVSPFAYKFVKLQGLFNWLLRKSAVRNFLKMKIGQRPPGLNDDKRNAATSLVWGRVTNAAGKSISARLCGSDAYTLTAHSSLIIAKKILDSNFKSGYQTPASAYGENLVLEIPGVIRE